ncbi:MAG: three-Cys-motif partner protein TcmP [Bacteroidota bacterium]
MKKNFNPIIEVQDDDLFIHDGHIWSEEKYKLVGGYCDIFTRGTRKNWDQLVYIDLFSGPGYGRIKENGKILKSSPLIALSLPIPFDKYIFCDSHAQSIKALEKRISLSYSDKNVHCVHADSNLAIEEIKSLIPQHGTNNKVLTFCFIDPYELNIHFDTINALTKNKLVDILILQAYFMDANRNYDNYIKEDNEKISKYLGFLEWRDDYQNSTLFPNDFVLYMVGKYDDKMKKLNYLEPVRTSIKIPQKNVKLYYLSFYSRHPLGNDFFKKVQTYASDQLNLGF